MAKKSQKAKNSQQKYLLIFVVAFAILGSFLLGNSLAAPKNKGGNGGNGGSHGTTTGSGICAASPNPSTNGGLVNLTASNVSGGGTGTYWFRVTGPTATAFVGATAPDANGSAAGSSYFYASGQYNVQYELDSGKSTTALASCSFTVQ